MDKKYLDEIYNLAMKAFDCNEVPVGAIVVKDGFIIGKGYNCKDGTQVATKHAEIVAIRNACKKLDTYDLSGYKLYTSCQPCPMCLSAIIWANIKHVVYACTKEDAAEIGFRDDMIYSYLNGEINDLLDMQQTDQKECKELFEEYKKNNKIIY